MVENMQQQRLDYIAKAVRSGRFVSLREIVDTFGVNIQTARRDVTQLAQSGTLVKVHGGAMPTSEPDVFSVDDRMQFHDAEKAAIGKAAAELVDDGDTIIMDGGSTTSYMIPHLRDKKIQIITNSISLLSLVEDCKGIDVIMTGGYYYAKSKLLLGPLAVKSIERINADKAFISAAGINSTGVFNSNILVVELEHAMIRQAEKTFLLADSSKFGKNALVRLCGFQDITTVITSGMSHPDLANTIQASGTSLVVIRSE
jgi:DeoR/GlpR family transcriptional regulator of sugar metabolism